MQGTQKNVGAGFKPARLLAATAIVTPFLATFKEFPLRQKPASFTIDQALEKMNEAASGTGH